MTYRWAKHNAIHLKYRRPNTRRAATRSPFTVTRNCRYWSHCMINFNFISMFYCCVVEHTTTTTQPQHNNTTTTTQPQHNHNTTFQLLCCGCVVVVVLLWVLWTVALLCHRSFVLTNVCTQFKRAAPLECNNVLACL